MVGCWSAAGSPCKGPEGRYSANHGGLLERSRKSLQGSRGKVLSRIMVGCWSAAGSPCKGPEGRLWESFGNDVTLNRRPPTANATHPHPSCCLPVKSPLFHILCRPGPGPGPDWTLIQT
ncbi:hypothetical protein D4764_07G0011610 [Takifugu flavidus]|uniref:Uncharacterized protein n=1 Tax=Takifugu flavidus TaxID=433684 RepID=A0A5C6MT80_9TELE|nr:hypothetical protein D4764_07G0011610 [Takifugu flavidus]